MGQSWEVTGPDRRDIGSSSDPIRSVSITLVGGSVDVVSHASGDVMHYEVGEVEGPALHVSTERGTVAISQVRQPGAALTDTLKSFLTTHRRRVRMSVSVPEGTKVTVNTVGADVLVGGLTGPVGVNTVSGAVRLTELSGRTDVKTASGAIDGSALRGELLTKTVSGATTLEATRLRSAKLATVEGPILLDLVSPSCLVTANTVSSDVTLRIPAGAGYDVTASSASGHVVVDGHTLSGGPDREKGGHRGEGDRSVAAKVRSVSGNIVVLREDAGARPVVDAGLGEVQDEIRSRPDTHLGPDGPEGDALRGEA